MSRDQLEIELESVHPAAYGWAMTCCGQDRDRAEDVLQTAYLKVLEGRATFKGNASFKTWLFGVVRFTALELGRKEKRVEEQTRHPQLVEDHYPVAGPPEPDTTGASRAHGLPEALKGLAERQREVLHLVFYQEMTIAEAAEVMEVSLGTARTHYERGKKRLRATLAEANES